nr:hypothetical protein [Kibdelosporangium sp. MJ126-NF4]CTQ96001.1 hypothetical protein [Kibdelosporangium sp. MJ126-NF4]
MPQPRADDRRAMTLKDSPPQTSHAVPKPRGSPTLTDEACPKSTFRQRLHPGEFLTN